MPKARMLLTILGTAALVAAPVTIAPAFVGFDAAYAKNGGEGGKGNGGGNGNGNGGDRGNSGNAGKSGEAGGKKSGSQSAASTGDTGVSGKTTGKPTVTASGTTKKSNHGALASQLKGLNAAHASAQAFANASPNSKVGQLRAYAEANNAALAAEDAAAAAAAEVARLAGLTPEEAALEFPDPVGYDQAAYDSALAEAQAAAEISGDLTEVERLQNLSAEERATSYPSDWDPAAAQAEAVAEATAAQAAADAAAAEAAALADTALADAGGANLTPEARAYLDSLLEGKVPVAATPAPVEDDEAALDDEDGTVEEASADPALLTP